MPTLSITVRNAKLVANGLQNLRAEIPKIAKNNIEGVFKRAVKQMKDYPPPPPRSKYQRTFKFRDSWVITPMVTGFKVTNKASRRGVQYSNYVVGDATGKGQAWMHVGRWLLFRDVIDFEMTKLPDTVEEHIKIKAKAEGLG